MSHIRRTDGPDRLFHITARVNWRAWHLETDQAKSTLADLIIDAATEFGVFVLACVLMSNHMHAVLQSPPEPIYRRLTGRRTPCRHFRPWPANHQKSTVIGQLMRVVRRGMSVLRQSELELSGRFWEAAYDARPITNPLSLLVRVAYDHRNPTKAGVVVRPEDYPWSTANEWATGKKGPIPLILPDSLPFGLRLDEFRKDVTRYQRLRQLDDLDEGMQRLILRGADPATLRDALASCGIDAAIQSRKFL